MEPSQIVNPLSGLGRIFLYGEISRVEDGNGAVWTSVSQTECGQSPMAER